MNKRQRKKAEKKALEKAMFYYRTAEERMRAMPQEQFLNMLGIREENPLLFPKTVRVITCTSA